MPVINGRYGRLPVVGGGLSPTPAEATGSDTRDVAVEGGELEAGRVRGSGEAVGWHGEKE